ncbi:MAG: 3-isopropylmalate dehydratase small subunit [Thermoplasmata archaeon]|nr:3-isopropylmalate dehydratase small subunit [Thermoplasmata archaeon]
MKVQGRIWKFGDDVSTDLIIPGRHLNSYDPDHLAAHAMEGASKEFSSQVEVGDIVLAGRNFGCGSSREQAVTALVYSGISCVVARSYARIFYRNAVNLGLPVFESDEAYGAFTDGEVAVIETDLKSPSLSTAGCAHQVMLSAVPLHAARILESGGLVPYVKARIEGGVLDDK